MPRGHRTTDYEKIEWLLQHPDLWAGIKPSNNWWPSPDDVPILHQMVPLAKAQGLYAPSTYYKDIAISLWRMVQRAWLIRQRKERS